MYSVIKQLGALCLMVLLTTGCTTVELIKSAAQGVFQEDEGSVEGVYKVGNPYQIEGKWYYPKEEPDYEEEGIASWYGSKFHNKPTANGEVFDKDSVSAAHRTLPLPSVVIVTNLDNGKKMSIRINDRGPFAKNRIIDLSEKAAEKLGFKDKGTQRVRVVFDKNATEKLLLVRNAKQKRQQSAHSYGLKKRSGYNTGYYVQVGAFGEERRAEDIKTQISGIPAVFVEHAIRGDKALYRVRVGPVRDEKNADKLLRIVQKKGFSDAVIVKN